MKIQQIWNLDVKRGADGSKHLDIQMHGVIDDGWDDSGVDSADVIGELNKHADAKTIGVRINSIGGSAFGGVALYNALQAHSGEVTCCVEGLAASAASLVAMAGKTVMGKGSMMMVHSPSAMAMGNSRDLRKTADVLDKVQESLAEIYKSKTGKSLDEINDMLDDETWMTADDAVAHGFADEVMPDVKTDYAPGEQVPSEQPDEHGGAPEVDPGSPKNDEEDGDPDEDDPEGDEEEDDDKGPKMVAAGLNWGGVVFPVAAFPERILAMAKPLAAATLAPPETPPVQRPATAKPKAQRRRMKTPAPPPVLAIVQPSAPPPPLSRAEMELRAPDVLAAFKADGHAAGVAAERARLQAIDELNVQGCADLVAEAKYGKPSDAPTLCMAVVKAGKVAGADLLQMRRIESSPLAAVVAGTPDSNASTDEARHIQAMIAGGNARREEKR